MSCQRHSWSARAGVLAAAALIACAGACSSNSSAAPAGTAVDGQVGGSLVVFAAASLTNSFEELARGFEAAHPGVDLKLNFAGSQSLRNQIENGAQPQVFASANPGHLEALRRHGLVQEPVVFARNELVIVVPADNPARIQGLADLPSANRLVLAGEAVPAGQYAEEVLASAVATQGSDFVDRVMSRVVSRETNVRQTLQKVVLGEADAAIVYATDARSAGDRVVAIPIADEYNVIATYAIATVEDAPRSNLGELFVQYVRSSAGVVTLGDFGFKPAEVVADSR